MQSCTGCKAELYVNTGGEVEPICFECGKYNPPESYAAREIRRILDLGPYPGEDFYRLKVSGNGATPHVNVTPEQLEAIAAIL